MTTTAFTAAGSSATFTLKPGQSATYAVTGTFTGYVSLHKSSDAMTFALVEKGAVDTGISGTVKNETVKEVVYQFRAEDTDAETALTGTATAVITRSADTLYEVKDKAGNVVFAVTDNGIAVTGTEAVSGTAVSAGISTQSEAKCTANVGTAAAGVTAVEYGDGHMHTTVLTVDTTLGAIAGGAALALGKLLYTLPAGAQVVDRSYFSLAITQTEGHINADTPNVCLGTVVGSGAVATLAGTATFYNVGVAQKAAANCTGTATVQTNVVALVREAADAKTIYANVAATWAASGDAAAKLTGTVTLRWTTMDK